MNEEDREDEQEEPMAFAEPDDEISQRPGLRRLTQHERRQVMADHGCDTWEEYRGER